MAPFLAMVWNLYLVRMEAIKWSALACFQMRDFKGLGRWGTRPAMVARLSSQFGFSEFHEVFGSEVSETRPGSGQCKCDVTGCI